MLTFYFNCKNFQNYISIHNIFSCILTSNRRQFDVKKEVHDKSYIYYSTPIYVFNHFNEINNTKMRLFWVYTTYKLFDACEKTVIYVSS